MSTREEMIAHGARRPRSPRARAATRWPTCRSEASTRRSRARARRTATRASQATIPLAGTAAAQRKDAFENALPLVRA
jgi:hypothetical protein